MNEKGVYEYLEEYEQLKSTNPNASTDTLRKKLLELAKDVS